MQRTILIPTDFSVESLRLLKAALLERRDYRLKILLVYGYHSTGSITELLFHSPSKVISRLSSAEFSEAIAILQNRLSSRIESLKVLLFTGKTNGSFRSFLKENAVDELVVPDSKLPDPGLSGTDLLPFMEKSSLDKLYVELDDTTIYPDDDKLAALFAF